MPPRLAHRLTLAAVLLLHAGCAGYRLGPGTGLAIGARTIEITPFPNQTEEPRLSPALASALRRQIQTDGTYQLETRGKGDLRLTGNIIQYRRVGVTFQPDDLATARDFELRMTAQIKVLHCRTGQVLLERAVTGRTLIRAFDDPASAERQALPLLAGNLARRIAALLADSGW